jgi:O-antigen biosynthesis protein WbqP
MVDGPGIGTHRGRDTSMKRAFDLIISGAALILLSPVMAVVAIAVRLTSPGPALYWSDRVGADSRLFSMPKFRSMRIDTPQVATHLLTDGKSYLTPIGSGLRRSSLDELPQLWSVLKGEMSLVGPRPALFNQDDLMALRREANVDGLRPGITGWAQVNGRDDLPIDQKVAFERVYLERQNLMFDLEIIGRTVANVIGARGVSH